MARDMIMANKWTDDEIFEMVQMVFGVDPKRRRNLVAQARFWLKLMKKNPPGPIYKPQKETNDEQ